MHDIDIKNLSVYYGSVCALQDINLKVESNKFLGIIGPNGGGKTTLLKTILGLVKPSSGQISIKRNYSIGYVPQFTIFNKNFPINVLDVILMGRLSKKIKWFQRYSSKDKNYAESIMNNLGILDLKNRQIGQLSGGQLQKVLIARALITDPKILMLDEPTANLDTKTKKEIYEMLNRLNENKTILIVSHDMKDIFTYIDSAVFINGTSQYYTNPQKLQKGVFEKMYGPTSKPMLEERTINRLASHREDKYD